jgi:uncharacterized protein YkwD
MVPLYKGRLRSYASRAALIAMGAALLFGGIAAFQRVASVSAQFGKSQRIELEGEADGPYRARIRWRIHFPGVVGITTEVGAIRIYRAHPVEPGNFQYLLTLPANATSFTDTSVKAGSSWIYRIQTQGRKPAQLSAPSNAVLIKLPVAGPDQPASQNTGGGSPTYTVEDATVNSAVHSLSAKAIGPNEIELRWAAPNLPKASSMRIFRAPAGDANNFQMVGAMGIHLGVYVDKFLKPNTTYLYQVKYNLDSHGARLSAPSNTASARTPDGPQPNARAAAMARRPKPGIPFELPPFGFGNAAPYDALEEELLYQLNQYRRANGVGPVRASISLSIAADQFSRQLAESGATGSKFDYNGVSARARAAGYLVNTTFDTVIHTTKSDPSTMLDLIQGGASDKATLLNPAWKIVGIGRNYEPANGAWRWVLDFAASWDKTIPLPGEDTDGRIDGNERIHTRPSLDAIESNARLTGYGDDGKPYSSFHCDIETRECWKDPVESVDRSLRESSYPENMIGEWHVQYQVSPKGVVHFNDFDHRYDMTEFAMSLKINEDGTWISQGYRSLIEPNIAEAGTWKWVHDAARGEEIVTFYRGEDRPTATIRVHAAPGAMTFFAVDGAGEMMNFFKGVAADANRKDDPRVIFMPGLANLNMPFPAAMRCTSCPQTQP